MAEYHEVKSLVRRSIEFKKDNEYQRALELLQQGLEEYPDNNYLKASLADVYLRMNRLAEAEALAEQVLREKPQNYQALAVKGNLAFGKHDYQRAIDYFKEAYQIKDTPYLASRLIRAYINNENLEQALVLCRERLELDPGNDRFKIIEAEIYKKLDDKERALDSLEEYLEDNEDHFAYKEKIKLMLADKNPEAALRELRQLLRIKKYRNNPHLITLLGEQLQENQEYLEAVDVFKEVLLQEPDNIYVKKNLGLALYKAGKLEKALPYLKDTLKGDPHDFYVRSTLQFIFKKLDKQQEGMDFIRELINETGLNNLWGVYHKLARDIKEEESE
ncbi:MAG TPA: tetratricopeptide repeat protein [Halanaerobiales bacterium]|nr:tetratricopeptide repeat protein [Halanaerobiales bacterium]